MVTKKLLEQLKNIINIYGMESKQAYRQSMKIAFELESKYNRNTIVKYYNNSIEALTEYIISNNINPNEKTWNINAVKNNYLSSETLGYLYGEGFNKLCKDISKELKNRT